PSQRAQIAVRLGARVQVGDEVTGSRVGLGVYRCEGCTEKDRRARGCRLEGRTFVSRAPIQIAHHDPPRAPDQDRFCPASVPGIWDDKADLDHLLSIKHRHGGLYPYFGRFVSDLPEALVLAYERADAAEENFTAEVRAEAAACAAREV